MTKLIFYVDFMWMQCISALKNTIGVAWPTFLWKYLVSNTFATWWYMEYFMKYNMTIALFSQHL